MIQTTCLHHQLNTQKVAILRSMVENFQKDLNKFVQVSMLQKTVPCSHSGVACSENVCNNQEISHLKSTLEDLYKQVSFVLNCDTLANMLESPKKDQLTLTLNAQSSVTSDSEHLEPERTQDSSSKPQIFVKEEHDACIEENNMVKDLKVVPKIDRHQYMGFKPHKAPEQQKVVVDRKAQNKFNLKDALDKLITKNPKVLETVKTLNPEEQAQFKAQYDSLKATLLQKRFNRIKANEAMGHLMPRKSSRASF